MARVRMGSSPPTKTLLMLKDRRVLLVRFNVGFLVLQGTARGVALYDIGRIANVQTDLT